jgi:hypothetical protein
MSLPRVTAERHREPRVARHPTEKPPPASPVTHNQHTSSLDQKTDIHIYGVGDGHEEWAREGCPISVRRER